MTPSEIEPATFRLVAIPQPTALWRTPAHIRTNFKYTTSRNRHLNKLYCMKWGGNTEQDVLRNYLGGVSKDLFEITIHTRILAWTDNILDT